MPEGIALALALVLLAAALGAAVARSRSLPEAAVATGGASLLVATGALSLSRAGDAVRSLAPTVAFLAALLLIAEGCRRDGLFDAIGALMARGAAGSPLRLLAFVFAVAAGVTAVLSLDATVVLLTPVVFATAARMRTSARPHVYACSHLANSASLLLPVSNLTNLLAFHASGLTFAHFGALMAFPTLAVIAVEWAVIRRFFAVDLERPRQPVPAPVRPSLPRLSLITLTLTLTGFALSSVLGVAPVWFAVAGAVAISTPALAARATSATILARAVEPGFLIFVLGLAVIVQAASDNGLAAAVRDLLPAGTSLPDLLAIAAISAVLANLVNNLPATLIVVPVAVTGGDGAVLAALIGVNVGPNLTYVGSLATLLWRRVLHAEDTDVSLREFVTLGALTVPTGLIAATVVLWCALNV
ncbi:MAG TPA: SLC13 family permease [Solirubrobacteraceae bacterium]|nr:SLC13 family permease [Solirubrobacteraceae bacterium]